MNTLNQFLAVDHVQSTISNLAVLKPKSQVQHTKPQAQKTSPFVLVQPKSTTQSLDLLQQQQASNAALAKLQWETLLRCGYSIDTDRCACYDRKGVKAKVEFERCKELATGERP